MGVILCLIAVTTAQSHIVSKTAAAAQPESPSVGANDPPTPPEKPTRLQIFARMANEDKNLRYKYLPLLVFQFLLAVLFFVFADYDEDNEVDLRGFMDVHVMIFVGFGFLMTFLKRYSFSAVGLNLLLSAVTIQWAIFCMRLWPMIDSGVRSFSINMKTLVEGDISAATVLITFGVVLGYASPTQLLFIAIVEIFISSSNAFMVWDLFMVSDIGGSICTHTFGAYFGLGVSIGIRAMTYYKIQTNNFVEGKNSSTYTSDMTAMIGTLFLWIYWPTFNATLAYSDTLYQRAFINTYLSLASCTVATFVISALLNHRPGRFEMVHVQNSTLAGGVAVGTIANMNIGPGGAILVGIGAAILSVCGYLYITPKLNRLGFRDTCGVHNLHGIPGIYSGLLGVLFAAIANREVYGQDLIGVFPGMAVATQQRSPGLQAFFQLVALVVTIMIAIVSGLVTGMLCNFCPLPYKDYYEDNPVWDMPHDYPGREELAILPQRPLTTPAQRNLNATLRNVNAALRTVNSSQPLNVTPPQPLNTNTPQPPNTNAPQPLNTNAPQPRNANALQPLNANVKAGPSTAPLSVNVPIPFHANPPSIHLPSCSNIKAV